MNEWMRISQTLLALQNMICARLGGCSIERCIVYRVPAVCLRQCFLVLIVDVVQHCGGSVAVSTVQANVLSHCAPRRTGANILIKLFLIFPSPSLAFPSLLSLLSDDDMDNLGMVQLKIVIWK